MNRNAIKLVRSIAAASAACMVATLSVAQEAATREDTPKEPEGLAEIVVTAQKRSQNQQDVPITITTLSGEQLESRGIKSIGDLDKASPGLMILAIRGSAGHYCDLHSRRIAARL